MCSSIASSCPTFWSQVGALDVEGAGPHDDLLQNDPKRVHVALLGAAPSNVPIIGVLIRFLASQQLGRGPQLS